MTTNQTIDGVPREQMISFPRELSDELAELIAEKARVCGGGAFEIWEAICDQFGTQAQPQGEPVAWVECSPAWLKAGGDCATAPRLCVGREGISHLHPAHAEQPAPVAVVMPERYDESQYRGTSLLAVRRWNACLDELKRLNPSL